MRALVSAIAAGLIATGSLAQDAPTIRVEPAPAGGYQLTLTARDMSEPAEAQRLLLPTARTVCGEEFAHFGRYTFTANKPLGSGDRGATLTLIQDVTCGSPPAEAVSEKVVGAPLISDDKALRSATERYFRALADSDLRAAYILLHPTMHGGLPFEGWAEKARAAQRFSGANAKARIAKLTRYDNPSNAPTPGVYVAVDYTATAEKLAFECGYLVWSGQPDGTARVIRHERNLATKVDLAKASPEQVAVIKAQFGCVER